MTPKNSPRVSVVERTIAWINRCRRLAKDYENLNRTAIAFIRPASIGLMLRRLTRYCYPSLTSRTASKVSSFHSPVPPLYPMPVSLLAPSLAEIPGFPIDGGRQEPRPPRPRPKTLPLRSSSHVVTPRPYGGSLPNPPLLKPSDAVDPLALRDEPLRAKHHHAHDQEADQDKAERSEHAWVDIDDVREEP